MRILLIMDPGILVPPKGYGGHERLLYMFARAYSEMGHDVHLLVTKGSEVEGCKVHGWGKEGFPPRKLDAFLAIPKAWWFLWRKRRSFDLIHNFGRLAYLLPIMNADVRKIMTYGREISVRNIMLINKFSRRNLVFTGCSSDLVSRGNVAGEWKVVYNAIDFSKYRLTETVADDAPLIFLGRIERVKGCHTAIKVAVATGKKLWIAGNVSPLEDERRYFEEEIRPHIDNKQITYLGALDDEQKNHYLGKASALLFPIEWNEPFGMVMVEAMACGTPVLAFRKGSVPEVIKEGITGFVVQSLEDMILGVNRIKEIARKECRIHALQEFDVKVIAQQYLRIFY